MSLDLAFVQAGASVSWKTSSVSCATSGIVADGASMADQSMVFAFSASRPFGECKLNSGADGPPTKLQIARWLGPPHPLQAFGPTLDVADDSLAFVRVLPAPGGGVWIAFRYAGLNALSPPPVDVMRLTASGKIVFGPVPVTPSSAGSVALAPLGDGLAVAWEDFEADPTGTIRVRVFDGKLAPQADAQVPHPPGHLMQGLSLVTAPSGLDAIVGWIQSFTSGDRAFVSRLTCFVPD